MGLFGFAKEIIERATPIREISDLAPLIEKVKDKSIVMLGESTHGTKEFYEWRKEISLELIRHHDFQFIAVEGDWPPCQAINRFIQEKERRRAFDVLSEFNRWPTWMWANTEVMDLIEELKELNSARLRPIGFHGLDLYSFYDSIKEVIKLLKRVDPDLAQRASEYYSCLDPYRHDEKAYAKSLFKTPEGCQKEVITALSETLRHEVEKEQGFKYETLFDAQQNARIVQNAEKYYRAMVFSEEDSWNVRDRHMMETLDLVRKFHGPGAKGIVWAHNTHIGDYWATDMLVHDQINIGGLARESYGKENVALVGFTTYSGTVTCSDSWDGPTQIMYVPGAKLGSVEAELHGAVPHIGAKNFLVSLDAVKEFSPLKDFRGQRAIGVIYHPDYEGKGNYVPTSLADRYDIFVHIDQGHAITSLPVPFDHQKIPDTFPRRE